MMIWTGCVAMLGLVIVVPQGSAARKMNPPPVRIGRCVGRLDRLSRPWSRSRVVLSRCAEAEADQNQAAQILSHFSSFSF